MKEAIKSLLQPELVIEAATQWDSTEEATLLDDVTNLVYEIKSPQGRRILRLTHSSHHTEDEIIAELDWMNYLIQQDIPASCPLLSKNNRLTEHYSVQNSYFVATAFEYAPGHFVDWTNSQEWNPALIQTFGRIMGRMHHVTKQYNPKHLRQKRSHWYEDDLLRNAADYLPFDQRQVATDLENLLLRFSCLTPTVDDYGLVHDDVNPTNFHVNDGQLILFDFDDCAYNWFINDIAIALPLYSEQFANLDWETKVTEFLEWYMRGYSEENHLDEGWLEYLPACLRLQNIITLIACHQDNVPNSQYHSFYELVLKTYREGHPLFLFDFRKAYKSLN
jgi:Ser/Thr protein kinase RdoA (MazF antagonist)